MRNEEQSAPDASRRNFCKWLCRLWLWQPGAISSRKPRIRLRRNRPAAGGTGTDKFVAIQIGGRSFVDEGVDACLHTLQEMAAVNVVMATVFTYGSGLAGRKVHGEPLPDHGVQQKRPQHILRRDRRTARGRVQLVELRIQRLEHVIGQGANLP
jgi:hypothetical protein